MVVTGATALADEIAGGLTERGASVRRLDLTELRSEDAVRAAVASAADELGAIEQVVHAWVPASLMQDVAFMDLDESAWEQGCERALEAAWWMARQAIPHLRSTSGSLVFLVPTTGMAGGARHVMLAAYAEGARVLAKSCGRQLASAGVNVNTIATAPHPWVPQDAADELTRSISLSVPAFGRSGEVSADLAPLVTLLASPDAQFLTANTLTADGGTWMGL